MTNSINFCNASIFLSNAEALVCPVNCLGVMGKGLAMEFRKRFPYHSKHYQEAARSGFISTGEMFTVNSPEGSGVNCAVVFFPTKKHWKDPSLMEYITDGLTDLAVVIRDRKIDSIALPAIGCGLGGLDWSKVAPEIVSRLGHTDCRITVCAPQ